MKTIFLILTLVAGASACAQKVHAKTLSLYKWNVNLGTWVEYDARYVDVEFEIRDSEVLQSGKPMFQYDPSITNNYTRENIVYHDLKGKDQGGAKCLVSYYRFLRTSQEFLAVMYADHMLVYTIKN